MFHFILYIVQDYFVVSRVKREIDITVILRNRDN